MSCIFLIIEQTDQ